MDGTVFGVLGNIFTTLLFLSPIDTFWKIVKNRSTKEFESIPYVILLLSTTLWIYYGIIKPDVLVVTINVIGSLIMIIYLSIFLTFAPPRMKGRTVALIVAVNVIFPVTAILITGLVVRRQAQINTAGTLCDFGGFLCFVSPLSAMKTVVRTKSVEFMPFYLSLAYVLVGAMWSMYGLLIHDTFLLIPNGMGFVLAVVQLALYAWYRKPGQSNIANGALEEGQREHLISHSF